MRWLPPLVVAFALVAAPAAQAADSLLTPTALTLNTAVTENAAGFGVEGGEPNTTPPFRQQCDSGHNVGAARTAWYTIDGTGDQITVDTAGSDFDTSLFVYSASASGNLVGCSDDDGGGVTSIVQFGSTAGTTYFLQAGVACNEAPPSQCSQSPPAGMLTIRAGGPGSNPPPQQPANPNTPAPPATSAGPAGPARTASPAALPVLHPTVSTTVVFGRNFTRFSKLNVSGAGAGASILLGCSGKKGGCPFAKKAVAVKSAKAVDLASLLKNAKLRHDTVLTVLVARPGFVGNVITFTMRNRHSPTRKTQCLAPGETKPHACP